MVVVSPPDWGECQWIDKTRERSVEVTYLLHTVGPNFGFRLEQQHKHTNKPDIMESANCSASGGSQHHGMENKSKPKPIYQG